MNSKNNTNLSIVHLPIDMLVPHSRNARIHSKKQIRKIADSIRTFGFRNPILIDESNTIIAGHGRWAAARLLGMAEIPTIRLEGLSPERIRAFAIADNRLVENGEWDEAILAAELQHLLTIDDDFDVTITGFEIPEIDILLAQPDDRKPDPDDNFGATDALSAVTEYGDLWQLGRHQLICENSTELNSFSKLLGSNRAEVVFCDPPYNVKINGNVSGKGLVRHRDFVMASGEMSESEFTTFLRGSLGLAAKFSVSGSIHFICMDWRHIAEVMSAGREVYDSLANVCVWIKNSGGLGSFYRSQHEFVFVFKNGEKRHKNNVRLGRHGRNRTNVWSYPSVNTLSKSSDEGNLLALHPTVKPVALIADALLDCSARGDIVLDAFLGSGSTLIAAERTGRCCFGIEIEPMYVDTAIKRWQRHSGDRAVHAATGKLFDDVAREKVGEIHE